MDAILIGLTGGIGAGKSVVSRILHTKGFSVYDCDTRAKELMIESESLNDELRSRFGSECVSRDNIDRARLAEIIFSDTESREWMEARVYEAVRRDIREWAYRRDAPAFVEAAIISRSGLADIVEYIWVVDASEETRLIRAMSRDGSDREKVMARMKAQEDELRSLPTHKVRLISNDFESPLLVQIDTLLSQLTSKQ